MPDTTLAALPPGSIVPATAVANVPNTINGEAAVVVTPSYGAQFAAGISQVYKKMSVQFITSLLVIIGAIGAGDVARWVESLPIPAWSVNVVVAIVVALLAAAPQWGRWAIKKLQPDVLPASVADGRRT